MQSNSLDKTLATGASIVLAIQGILSTVPLINREVAEVRAPEEFVLVYTEADALIAHGLGVKL